MSPSFIETRLLSEGTEQRTKGPTKKKSFSDDSKTRTFLCHNFHLVRHKLQHGFCYLKNVRKGRKNEKAKEKGRGRKIQKENNGRKKEIMNLNWQRKKVRKEKRERK
jgi:hypothetical protein